MSWDFLEGALVGKTLWKLLSEAGSHAFLEEAGAVKKNYKNGFQEPGIF